MEGRVDEQRKDASGVAERAAPVLARCPLPKATRRAGAAAVLVLLFFLLKGLLWIAVPALLLWWGA
jgi:hypothetical protein